MKAEGELSEEGSELVAYLCNDIVEALPALVDLRQTAGTLTTSLYAAWTSLKVISL